MGRIQIIFVMVLVAAGLSVAQAEKLYKWVDDRGRISYHDQPPPEGAGYRVEEKNLGTGEKPVADKNQEAAAKFPIVLYATPKCASCDLARAYLDKRKVPYSEKNVESDPVLQQELKTKAGSVSVPTLTIGDKVMKGYLESLLDGELDAAGYARQGAPPAREEADQDKEEADQDNEEAPASEDAAPSPPRRPY